MNAYLLVALIGLTVCIVSCILLTFWHVLDLRKKKEMYRKFMEDKDYWQELVKSAGGLVDEDDQELIED